MHMIEDEIKEMVDNEKFLDSSHQVAEDITKKTGR